MEQIPSFNALIEKSIIDNWDLDSLTDYKGKTLQYHDVARKIEKLHIMFEASGVQRGDKIALCGRNSAAWAAAFLAILTYGAVAVPILHEFTPDQVHNIVNHSDAKLLFIGDVAATQIDATKMPGLEGIIYIPDYSLVVSRTEQLTYAREHLNEMFGKKYPKYFRQQHVHYYREQSPDELALINYTSGTTGSPKGVMLSFENIFFNVNAVSVGVPIFTPDVRTMVLLPCHHVLPLVGSLVAPFVTGGSVAFCPSLSAPDLMETLSRGGVGIVIGVPRLYTMLTKAIRGKIEAHWVTRALYKLCDKIGSRALSRLIFSSVRKKMGGRVKYFVSGGAALDPAVAQCMKTLGLDVLEGYGMTECAPMIAFTRPDDIKPGASGQPVPGCTVEVCDGELRAKGKNIMQGYYNRPEETAQVVRDGWIYTGDLGYIDDKGRVVVTGRRKEIIVLSNGKNVNPTEIEQHLESYAAIVKEAAVTEKDDALMAIIVPQPALASMTDSEIEQKVKWEVIDKYNADAAGYKKIFNIKIFRGDLPRTKLDKLQRFKLKTLLIDSATVEPEVVEEAQSDEYKILKKYIESEKVCKVHPTDHIELDLAFDSLDKVGLQVFINNSFGLNVSTDQLSQFRSVADMADYVAESKTKMQVEKIDWKKILREHTSLKLPQTWFTGRMFIALAQPFFRLYFKLTGKGADRIPDGPVIITPNHQSFLDGLFVMSFLKYRGCCCRPRASGPRRCLA